MKYKIFACVIALMHLFQFALGEGILLSADGANFSQGYYSAFATTANGFYAFDSVNAQLWRAGTDTSNPWPIDEISFDGRTIIALASDGSELYSIELIAASASEAASDIEIELCKIDPLQQTRATLCTLSLPEAVSEGEYSMLRIQDNKGIAVSGNKLYIVYATSELQSGELTFTSKSNDLLLCFDIRTGKRETYPLKNIQSLVTAQDSTVVMAQNDSEAAFIHLLSFNCESEKLKRQFSIEDDGGAAQCFCYNASTRELFYLQSDLIRRLNIDSGEDVALCKAPIADICALFPTADGLFACSRHEVALLDLRGKSPLQIDRELVISGGASFASAFGLASPELSVKNLELESEELINSILTRKATPDVFFLNTNDSTLFKRLKEKAYLLPIEDESLQSFIEALHPDVKNVVLLENGFCGLPVQLHNRTMLGVNTNLWNELNLGALPKSWADWLKFVEHWSKHTEAYPQVKLLDTQFSERDLKNWVLGLIETDFGIYRSAKAAPVDYNSPLYRDMMQTYEAIDFQALTQTGEGTEQKALFMGNYFLSVVNTGSAQMQYAPLPLGIDSDSIPNLFASLDIAVINPYSANRADALAFLRYVSQNLDPIARAEMIPSENEPLRPGDYAQRQADYLQRLSALDAQMQTAEPVDQTLLKAEMQTVSAELEELEKNAWLLSESSIKFYRSHSTQIHILFAPEIDIDERIAAYEIRLRYIDAQLSLDEYLSQLNRRLIMSELEG